MSEVSSDEQLLERLRQWLSQTRAEAETLASGEAGRENGAGGENGAAERNADDENPAAQIAADQNVGIYRLVEEFTALRQEVKLQTRSARGLDEQTQTLLSALQRALESLRSIEPKEREAAWTAARPLALALAELDEAFDRGRLQIERASARLLDEGAAELLAELDEFAAAQSWWRRLLLGKSYRRLRSLVAQRLDSQERTNLFDALLEGFGLIQQRLRRALAAEGIDRIPATGQPVDPEQMIVVEVADAPGSPAGVVLDEIRRGYAWKGRVLRHAEVRAARGGAV